MTLETQGLLFDHIIHLSRLLARETSHLTVLLQFTILNHVIWRMLSDSFITLCQQKLMIPLLALTPV
jgi:hypothetical protein